MCVYQFRHLGRCVCSKERNYSRAYRAVKHFETESETGLASHCPYGLSADMAPVGGC